MTAKRAFWAIDVDKTPVSNGYGIQFFKDAWEIVG